MAQKFEIGVKEEHSLVVNYNVITKRITIDLDGQNKVSQFSPSPFAKKFTFDVGTTEAHKVEVSIGPFSSKVLVDGKPAQPHQL